MRQEWQISWTRSSSQELQTMQINSSIVSTVTMLCLSGILSLIFVGGSSIGLTNILPILNLFTRLLPCLDHGMILADGSDNDKLKSRGFYNIFVTRGKGRHGPQPPHCQAYLTNFFLDKPCYHGVGYGYVEIKEERWQVQDGLLLWLLPRHY